jgi:WD40 repeat protein
VGEDRFRLGPPRNIPLPFGNPERISLTTDGRQLAVVNELAGLATTVDVKADFRPGPVLAHANAGFLAQSRDGRWLATSGWHSDVVRLWEAPTGRKVREWTGLHQPRVFFAPDNRELLICQGDKCTAWNVETGQPGRQSPSEVALYSSFVAFSPDGRLMARQAAPGIVEISEVATGRTSARLADPFGDRAGWIAFTPDNRRLVVTAGYGRVVHVWELDTMRRRLAARGLSGDWPGFAPLADAPPPSAAANHRAATIEVIGESPNSADAPSTPDGNP